jgi:hypothetical protein
MNKAALVGIGIAIIEFAAMCWLWAHGRHEDALALAINGGVAFGASMMLLADPPLKPKV